MAVDLSVSLVIEDCSSLKLVHIQRSRTPRVHLQCQLPTAASSGSSPGELGIVAKFERGLSTRQPGAESPERILNIHF